MRSIQVLANSCSSCASAPSYLTRLYDKNERRNGMRITLLIHTCTCSAHPIWVRPWRCLIGPVHLLSVIK